jgi:hypothetical protein
MGPKQWLVDPIPRLNYKMPISPPISRNQSVSLFFLFSIKKLLTNLGGIS